MLALLCSVVVALSGCAGPLIFLRATACSVSLSLLLYAAGRIRLPCRRGTKATARLLRTRAFPALRVLHFCLFLFGFFCARLCRTCSRSSRAIARPARSPVLFLHGLRRGAHLRRHCSLRCLSLRCILRQVPDDRGIPGRGAACHTVAVCCSRRV